MGRQHVTIVVWESFQEHDQNGTYPVYMMREGSSTEWNKEWQTFSNMVVPLSQCS